MTRQSATSNCTVELCGYSIDPMILPSALRYWGNDSCVAICKNLGGEKARFFRDATLTPFRCNELAGWRLVAASATHDD